MARRGIVRGQRVVGQKLERVQQLRAESTPAETVLWARLRRNQLAGLHFRRQQVIDGFVTDFYCHSAAVVLELDGPIHQRQASYDRERDRVIAAHNLLVVRLPNADILNNIESVLARIQDICLGRAQTQRMMTE